MKILFPLLKRMCISILSITALLAQSPNLQWEIGGIGGAMDDLSQSMVADQSGNTYVTGTFNSASALFTPIGPNLYMNSDGTSSFICKYDPNGYLLWAKKIHDPLGSNSVTATSVDYDISGNVFVTGTFISSIQVDTITTSLRNGLGNTDIFICKFNGSNGQLMSIATAGGTGADEVFDISTYGFGAYYIAGSFSGGPSYFNIGTGHDTLYAYGMKDAYVAYVSSGNLQWVKQISGDQDENVKTVMRYPGGNIYIAGDYASSIDIQGNTLTSLGASDVFVASLSSAGSLFWAKSIGGMDLDEAIKLTVDSNHIYLTGNFMGTADFNPSAVNTFPLSSNGSFDVYVACLNNANGNFVWADKIGGAGYDGSSDVTINGANVYVSGAFQSTVDFDPGPGIDTLTSTHLYNGFVEKLNTAGNHQWVGRISGNNVSSNSCSGVAAINSGDIFVTGYFMGSIDCTPILQPTPTYIESNGSYDVFITRWNQVFLGLDHSESNLSRVYPNPSAEKVFVETNKNASHACLYDSYGKQVLVQNLNNMYNQISLQGLPAGIYFLQIYFENKSIEYAKVIKQ